MSSEGYTGSEESRLVTEFKNVDPEGYPWLKHGQIPPLAAPIYDDEVGVIIGFQVGRGGVYRVFDLDGKQVGMYEEPLEQPLFDPIDLVFVFGGLLRSVVRGSTGSARSERPLSVCSTADQERKNLYTQGRHTGFRLDGDALSLFLGCKSDHEKHSRG